MFLPSISDALRLLLVVPIAYVTLIVFLRISGKRMLSKMNAFDLVVTIALGSTLATVILSKQVALVEGLLALALLLALQYLAAWSSARHRTVRRIIKSEPAIVFYEGAFLSRTLKAENLAEEAVRAAVRNAGFGTMDDVGAVVLEADGSLSVLRKTAGRMQTMLEDPRSHQR